MVSSWHLRNIIITSTERSNCTVSGSNGRPDITQLQKQRPSWTSRRAWNAAKWRHVLFSLVFAVFLGVFHVIALCYSMLFFSKNWTKFKWHHSFVHVARGYSEMHVFKCRWCFRYSEMAFLQRLTYFFFDFDFSHSNYIIVHGATAKCMFLMEIVVSPQRNTII